MIAVTGANGYVGSRIISYLRARGHEAVALVRRPDSADTRERRYALGGPLEDSALDGVDTVVHAAYDLSVRGGDIREVNLSGSLPLLDDLAARGGRVVLISSLSAFEGARSEYGRTKLGLERAVLERDGIVVRPGLVFGAGGLGLFGAMAAALSRRSLAPLIGGGSQRLFVTHDEHLSELVSALATGQAKHERPLFAAHEVPTTLRAIATQIAAAHGRRLRAIPLPSPLIYAGLRSGELAGLPLPFRADSVRSLVNPIPLDQLSALVRSPVEFPPISPELWMR